MDKFAALSAFVAVVDEGGFAAAARRLGHSRSAINRIVINLEDNLQVQLLNRTTRSVAPTAAGRAFHERAKAILDQLAEAERNIGEGQREPVGDLRINAPMSFGTMHLAPALSDFMLQYPDVRIQLDLDDRFVDVVREGYDVTVRIAEPVEDTTVVDYRVASIRRVLCASPAFLETNGTPVHPRDLRRLQCLHYGNLPSGNLWQLAGPDSKHSVQVNGVLCSNNGEVLCEAALKGLGIALLPTFIVGEELQAGRLVTVMPDYAPSDLTLCVIYPPNRHLAESVRLLTDFLTERFGDRPYWDLVG